MAPTTKVLQFPSRNPNIPARSTDSLARDLHPADAPYDTQLHASRIAQQVEQEIARQAVRLTTGARDPRANRTLLMMPASIVVAPAPVRPDLLERIRRRGWQLLGR